MENRRAFDNKTYEDVTIVYSPLFGNFFSFDKFKIKSGLFIEIELSSKLFGVEICIFNISILSIIPIRSDCWQYGIFGIHFFDIDIDKIQEVNENKKQKSYM
jgi:hypothetical protein